MGGGYKSTHTLSRQAGKPDRNSPFTYLKGLVVRSMLLTLIPAITSKGGCMSNFSKSGDVKALLKLYVEVYVMAGKTNDLDKKNAFEDELLTLGRDIAELIMESPYQERNLDGAVYSYKGKIIVIYPDEIQDYSIAIYDTVITLD